MDLINTISIKQIEMLDHRNILIAEQIKLKYIETLKINKTLLDKNNELSNYIKQKEDECIFHHKKIDELNNNFNVVNKEISKLTSILKT